MCKLGDSKARLRTGKATVHREHIFCLRAPLSYLDWSGVPGGHDSFGISVNITERHLFLTPLPQAQEELYGRHPYHLYKISSN